MNPGKLTEETIMIQQIDLHREDRDTGVGWQIMLINHAAATLYTMAIVLGQGLPMEDGTKILQISNVVPLSAITGSHRLKTTKGATNPNTTPDIVVDRAKQNVNTLVKRVEQTAEGAGTMTNMTRLSKPTWIISPRQYPVIATTRFAIKVPGRRYRT
ncbi:hypothetical protein AB5N19_06463 [Seiridium cardinale]